MSTARVRARAVADAVLYEGYLLYPYRATSAKNRSRWQFGVLGPPGAEAAGLGENASLSADVIIETRGAASVSVLTRFLHLQHRDVEIDRGNGRFESVEELRHGSDTWVRWDEAVERESGFHTDAAPGAAHTAHIDVPAGADVEVVGGGRLVRRRRALSAQVRTSCREDGGLLRMTVEVCNTSPPARDADAATATSLIGTHLLLEVHGGEFVSLLEPAPEAAATVGRCRHHRCFPVLAGPPGARDLMLVSPIILYDHPEIAEQSQGALFDSTEIDEILTLRVMTLTDAEKDEARATDPLAAQIIDRCDAMTPEQMLELHGVLRDPHAPSPPVQVPEIPTTLDWWSPEADSAVRPDTDAVLIDGIPVSRGTRVRLHPRRRADAQDLFYTGKLARVTAVHEDVDGDRHIGVVLDDDPAADLHEWYGRYLYFAPEEVEPLTERSSPWR